MWECPDLFPLGDDHVLIISPVPLGKALYSVGNLREHRFEPGQWRSVDDGGYFYAPQSFTDDAGRRIMFGWVREGRAESVQRAAGWAGVMSLPRIVLPAENDVAGVEPARELRSLRGRQFRIDSTVVSPTTPVSLDAEGDALEILAEFDPGNTSPFGLEVRRSADGSEHTAIAFDPRGNTLWIDREHSSSNTTVDREPHGTHLDLGTGENLRLHIFLDRSIIEVYANSRASLTSRIYPARDDSLGLSLFAREQPMQLTGLDVWEMGSIWSNAG
jgi:beta-fructofuranosidase